jgi:hypothetical protein
MQMPAIQAPIDLRTVDFQNPSAHTTKSKVKIIRTMEVCDGVRMLWNIQQGWTQIISQIKQKKSPEAK